MSGDRWGNAVLVVAAFCIIQFVWRCYRLRRAKKRRAAYIASVTRNAAAAIARSLGESNAG